MVTLRVFLIFISSVFKNDLNTEGSLRMVCLENLNIIKAFVLFCVNLILWIWVVLVVMFYLRLFCLFSCIKFSY